MTDNTWDSAKKRLGRGQVFKVVAEVAAEDEVSIRDAEILVDRGLAEAHAGGLPVIKNMLKRDIEAELTDVHKVELDPRAKRGELADLLAATREEKGL